jgi:PilZ domain
LDTSRARKEPIVNIADRRRAERFIGAIPIELKKGKGLTRDFSTDGVYFDTDQLLSVGEQLDFILHLNHADPANPLPLYCHGTVLRVEPGPEKTGVAVAIATNLFQRSP